ncbi:MAG: caspase family protein [Pseudonocardiaceae bacterium]
MNGQRKALIVASDDYEHDGLRRLLAPEVDATALAGVLGDPQIGEFDVRVVHNETAHVIQERIEDLFSEARSDDVLLLHFSCHGLKSESGELFFAARNTRPNRLGSTAVPADFVQRCMRASRSRCIVLFLDCCYGGAFGQGVTVRAAGDVNVMESFSGEKLGGGRGRAVITASSSMEYAFEGDQLADDRSRQPSVFTTALVEGLATGEADRDEDGWVGLNELYDYVFDKVREQNPYQTPSRDVQMQGDLYLARSRRRRIRAMPIPPDLHAAMTDPNMFTRLGAVSELRSRLTSDNLPAAAGAVDALAEMARNDIGAVAEPAAAALHEVQVQTVQPELNFGQVATGSTPAHQTIQLLGPPLARVCTFEASHSWIRVEETAEGFDVSVDTSGTGDLRGAITLKGPTGELVIPVNVQVRPVPQPPRSLNVQPPDIPEQRSVSDPPHVPDPASSPITTTAPTPTGSEAGARVDPTPPQPRGKARRSIAVPLVIAGVVLLFAGVVIVSFTLPVGVAFIILAVVCFGYVVVAKLPAARAAAPNQKESVAPVPAPSQEPRAASTSQEKPFGNRSAKQRSKRVSSVGLGAPVPTFRVVALGVSGTGKTVFLASMFRNLSFQAPDRSFFLETELEQRVALSKVYSAVADTSQPWPTGTRVGETREFLFDCVAFDEDGNKHQILNISYLDYAGELLEEEQAPGGTALSDLKTRILSAHALLGMIDGYQIRQLMLNESAGRFYFEHSLEPMLGILQGVTCPIHLVITKWDLVRGFGEAAESDDNDRLALVVQTLMTHTHFGSLVNHSASRVIRLIPVSAVGANFVEIDKSGHVVKRPDGQVRATNVEVPVCAVLPDLFRQVQMSLDDSARKNLNSEIRGRLRVGAGEFSAALASFLRRPTGAALRSVMQSVVGKEFGNDAITLFVDWAGRPFDERGRVAGSLRNERERHMQAVQQTRWAVLRDFETAVLRLEARLPTSLLTRRRPYL